MTGHIEERQQEFVDLFNELDDPIFQYEVLMQIAGELEEYPPSFRDEKHSVDGCQSKTWIRCETIDENRIKILVDSEALIVKGMIGVIAQIMEGVPLEEAACVHIDYIEKTSLKDLVTSDRRNGIASAVETIQKQARELLERERNCHD